MTNISWYGARLRAMSLGEISWRAGQLARTRMEASIPSRKWAVLQPIGGWESAFAGFVRAVGRPVFLERRRAEVLAEEEPLLVNDLLCAAQDAVELRFSFFGYGAAELSTPINWSYDPIGDKQWPDLPAPRINHREVNGDVKWIWELNRLQHLPLLAQAWQVTGDEKFSRAAFKQLDSWMKQNPPGRGIAWRGAFEAGVRAIAVSIAIQTLRDAPGMTLDRYRAVLGMLAQSAHRCWCERSRFSSANNHLVGELAGLATVAILFPELPEAARWERLAVGALAAEADRQILPDGAGAEQAVGYQVFTAELLLLVVHLLWLRGRVVDGGDGGVRATTMMEAVMRSARYLAVLVGDNDPAPRYGDDDEGFAVRLGPEPVRTVREHLAIVGAASSDTELSRRGTNSLTANWFRRPHGVVKHELPDSLYARHGGLVVLRSGGRRLTMDVGPLGFPGIAAHGHADALTVSLSCDGVDLVTDPGSGSYYNDPERRRAHRSTRAHATVTVDRVDQSVMGGPFLWRQHARTTVHRVDLDAGLVIAEHDGYCRLDQPVVHRRWLIAPPADESVLVVDCIAGLGVHSATVSWPLAPALRASLGDGTFVARGQDDRPRLQVSYAASLPAQGDQIIGDEPSRLGWWSERLERTLPAALLGVHTEGPLPIAFATLLTPGDTGPMPTALNVSLTSGQIRVQWRCGVNEREVELAADASSATQPEDHRHVGPMATNSTDMDKR